MMMFFAMTSVSRRRRRNLNLVGTLQSWRTPLKTGDLVLVNRKSTPLASLADNVVLAILDFAEIEPDFASLEQPCLRGFLHFLKQVGVSKQGFGRNASAQQAGAAESGVPLDDRGFQTKLSRREWRRHIRRDRLR